MRHVVRGVAAKRTDDGGEVYGHGAAAADGLREAESVVSSHPLDLHQARPSRAPAR